MDALTEPVVAETEIVGSEKSLQETPIGSNQDTTQSELEEPIDKSQDGDTSHSNNKENTSVASVDELVTKECKSEVSKTDESAPEISQNKESDKIVTEEVAEKEAQSKELSEQVSAEKIPEESEDDVPDAHKEVEKSSAIEEDAMEVSEASSVVQSDAPVIENVTTENEKNANEDQMEDEPILLDESDERMTTDTEIMDVNKPVENLTSPKENATPVEPETSNDDDCSVQDSATKEADNVTETIERDAESAVEDAADDSGAPINDNLSDVDDQEMQQENPVFVHVSSKGDGESESDKNSNADLQNETGDESLEATSLVEEDPIGITQEPEKDIMELSEDGSEKEPPTIKVINFSEAITSDKNLIDDELVASKGADEELCIIPDTEREISQEEKDAARAAAAKAALAEVPRITILDHTKNSSTPVSDKYSDKSADTANKDSAIDTEGVVIISDSAETTETVTKKTHSVKLTHIPKPSQTEDTCSECNSVRKIQFSAVDNKTELKLCSQTCVSAFRKKKGIPEKETLKVTDVRKTVTRSGKSFVRKCSECQANILDGDEKVLCWETMDFCHEDCLSKFQNVIGSHCANCKNPVVMSSLGKYCVRFGHDIRQFCCSTCLEEFKKGLKVCSYCQRDISAGQDGFLAPVGDKGQFKDFCGPSCMEKYEFMSNKATKSAPVEHATCAVCNQEKIINVMFDEFEVKHKFCSEPCFIAFKYVNNVAPPQCEMCKNYFENEDCTKFSIYYENMIKHFCTKTCQNIYIIANRRIVPCSWCKVKKYNFDMIKKNCNNGQTLMMCSINCLSLFQVSINAVSTKKSKCDHCSKLMHAQYHLTMSDATIRNFCTYQCVMAFQNQFGKMPIALSTPDQPVAITTRAPTSVVPTSGPKRYTRASRATTVEPSAVTDVQMPVITNVQSLAAPVTNGPTPTTLTRSAAMKINNQQQTIPTGTQIPATKPVVKQQVIIKPPPMPPMKNAVTMCKPIMHTKGVSCRPHSCSKETQTDVIKEKTVLVPVPVPIYVPAPCQMYSAPLPVPIPFPIPIPVPIFIPTTRNSSAGIMKEIKKIQVKIPTDPFEAELLMMAEMVAGEKKVENTDSESEEDDTAGNCSDTGNDGGFSPEAVDTSNTFGDDMLQMALKMATELDEPAVDLEGALTANTITASQNPDQAGVVQTEEAVDDPQQPMHPMMDRQPNRGGRKRPARSSRSLVPGAKRGRRLSTHVEMPLLPPPAPSQPPEPIEKPDANMCLKYTFGVNAWKQWVTTKNAELEKSSRRVKLFKNEILQLTADELNYSLCLFVKEVRKPNGTEYAPDTIYYLCLGIQQYLFENGRIDNIFTDTYYEKFTDCLDEVARKFSVLYNDSHYIVTRVEEEHLWESKQLGAHSPHVLLSTLMFFNTKHFNLTTVDEHMQLSFSHIMKHWKRNPNTPGAAKIPGSRNVLLRFYPPQTTLDANSRKKKVYEQQENEDNPLRCPVKLYEFYLSKCPESVKTRNDVFYLLPERSCVPDSPVWYSTMALGREALEKMLHRVKMVKEINIALLTMD